MPPLRRAEAAAAGLAATPFLSVPPLPRLPGLARSRPGLREAPPAPAARAPARSAPPRPDPIWRPGRGRARAHRPLRAPPSLESESAGPAGVGPAPARSRAEASAGREPLHPHPNRSAGAGGAVATATWNAGMQEDPRRPLVRTASGPRPARSEDHLPRAFALGFGVEGRPPGAAGVRLPPDLRRTVPLLPPLTCAPPAPPNAVLELSRLTVPRVSNYTTSCVIPRTNAGTHLWALPS